MGNCLILGKSKQGDALPLKEDNRVLQIVRMDGKILEFRTPLLVRDLLVDYPSFYVGIFKEATQNLPLEYKLKIGKMYYLLPSIDHASSTNYIHRGSDHHEEQRKIEAPSKRIKVVLTKQQLKQLITKQGRLGLEELIISKVDVEPKKDCGFPHHAASSAWMPMLESIPEETGVVY